MDMKNAIDKYSTYNFEDFLHDDFFVSSIRDAKEDSIRFWIDYEQASPSNFKEYIQAKNFLEQIISQKEGREVTDALQQRINKTNEARDKKRQVRKRFFFISSVAAAICGLLMFATFYRQDTTSSIDLLQYVESIETSNALDTSQCIKLVLSETKIIELEKQESIIAYTKENIESDDKKISHAESAPYNQLIVPKGKRSQLRFSDGTYVHINSGTQVIYPNEFSANQREIYVDGEVFIDVAPNENQPFIVRANNFNVEVLGTKFNVLSYKDDDESQVVLASGSVQITSKSNIVLKPNEMYRYSAGGESVREVDVAEYTSWIQGMYIYEKEPLENIIKHLTRYYGIGIICSEEVEKLTCSGKIDIKDDLVDVLDNLAFILPVEIIYKDNQYLITLKQ